MTLKEFRALADTWGGDVERWPAASVEAARQIAKTPEGAEVLAEAGTLDALFGAKPNVSRERAERAAHAVVVTIAAGTGREQRTGGWLRGFDPASWFLPAASIACSALIGISLAMLLPSGGDQETVVLSMLIDSGSMAAGWTFQ
jgi:hypothetical protein